jgi:hypothetical protein
MSDSKCRILQVRRSIEQTDANALHNLDTSLSDSADEYSSNVQPFDDDDMYGSDHGMDIVSEASENEEVAKILEGPEEIVVSAGECPIMSEDLTPNRMIVSFSCFRRCTQIRKTC